MTLTQQETNKVKERDEQHTQELREWRADIAKRKQVRSINGAYTDYTASIMASVKKHIWCYYRNWKMALKLVTWKKKSILLSNALLLSNFDHLSPSVSAAQEQPQ